MADTPAGTPGETSRAQRDEAAAGAASGKNEVAPGVKVGVPAPDADRQPGFQVVEEAPRARSSKVVWTAAVVVIAILAGYALGYFR